MSIESLVGESEKLVERLDPIVEDIANFSDSAARDR